jgi:prophage regulatory protein
MLNSASTTAAATASPAANALVPSIPETGFMRQAQVLLFVPISRSTLWRRVKAGTFPEPVKLSARVTVWRAEDLRQWIAEQG